MKCKNFLVRSKNYKKYFYCKLYKKEIEYTDCKNCKDVDFKKIKRIKVVSKKKNVSRETYNIVYNRDKGICRLCGNNNIQLHHIIYRSEAKELIDEPSNCIMLCESCHRLVHSNKHYWQPILKEKVKE